MWEVLLAVLVIIIVSIICYVYAWRKPAPALLLGIAAGIVILVVTQTSNTLSLPTNLEIGSRSVLYILVATEIALGVYVALTHQTRKQIVLEKEE